MPTTNSSNKFGLPYLGYGLGLRNRHFDYIIKNKPQVNWFEIITENFMNSRGRPREKLDEIRAHYPVVMHGVSLSVGSTDKLDKNYLQKLKQLADEIKPAWISDHLCWTGINGKNTHDLLPMPLTKESLLHTAERIKQVQDFLGRPLLLENPSSYLTFRADEMPEYEFMAGLSERSDCALLLDVNNIYVASYNQRIDPALYLESLPQDRIVQIHLAGHTNMGTHILDTHNTNVNDAVWELYAHALKRFGSISTMVEWDGNIPEFPVLEAELKKAETIKPKELAAALKKKTKPGSNHSLKELQYNLQTTIHEGDAANADIWVEEKENFPPHKQVQVYIDGYRLRLAEAIMEDYPKTAKLLGDDMKKLVKEYIEYVPSTYPDLASYCWDFADFVKNKTADIERRRAKCFELENTEAATAQDFAKLSEEEFLALNIIPRAASFILGNFAIYRDGDEVKQIELEPQEIEFLQSGKTIGAWLEAATGAEAATFQQWFSKWLNSNFISLRA